MKTLLAFVLLTGSVLAQDQKQHALIMPGKLAAEWYFSDTAGTWDKDVKPETRVWLSVETANHRDFPKEGYNPSYVYVLVRDYKPVVKQIGKDRWQITFTSPIAEDLP